LRCVCSVSIGLNRFGREKNRTKINRFETVFGFGSVQKLKKNIGLVVYFSPKPDRTENAQTLLDWWWASFVLELILFCLEKGLANEVLASSEYGG